MKIITKSKDCFTCQSCCKFYKEEEYFAPVFTDTELEALPQEYRQTADFKQHKKSKNVFRVSLIPSKKEKMLLVCPFFDEEKQLCSIYFTRPFDCQLWPVVLTKSRKPKIININIAKKGYCPSLKNKSKKSGDDYYKYIIKHLNSKKITAQLLKYPSLVWGYESFTEKIGEINL